MVLKKPSQNSRSGQPSSATISTGSILASLPTLLEFLTLSTWDDGSPRLPGTILLFVDQGAWKCCLKDKNGPRVAFVTGIDLDVLFLRVEEGLQQDSLEWRTDKPQQQKR